MLAEFLQEAFVPNFLDDDLKHDVRVLRDEQDEQTPTPIPTGIPDSWGNLPKNTDGAVTAS